MRTWVIVMIFFVLTSCATHLGAQSFTAHVAAWKGKKVDSLLKKWGKPTILIAREHGAATYIYMIKTQPIEIPSTSPNSSLMIGPKGQAVMGHIPQPPAVSGTLKCVATFEVNKEGIIIQTKSQGSYCLAP